MTHNLTQREQSGDGPAFLARLISRLLAIVALLCGLNLFLVQHEAAQSPSGIAGLVCGLGIGMTWRAIRKTTLPSALWLGVGLIAILLAATAAYWIAKALVGGN